MTGIKVKRLLAYGVTAFFIMSTIVGCRPKETGADNGYGNSGNNSDTNESDISAEYDIVGIIDSDLFYNPVTIANGTDEERFLELRGEAITLFNAALKKLAGSTFNTTAALKKHEDLLFNAMDNISSDPNGTIQKITENMLAYRTAFLSNEDQIKILTGAASDKTILQAHLDRLSFETICKQVDLQINYVSWLMGSSEVVLALLEPESADQAQELLTACTDLYQDEIGGILADLLTQYYDAAEIYTYILSADYSMGKYYLDEIENILSSMKSEGVVRELSQYCKILREGYKKPLGYIKESTVREPAHTPDITNTQMKSLSAPSLTNRSQDQTNFALDAIELVEQLLKRPIPSVSNGLPQQSWLKDIILNTEKTNAIKDSYGLLTEKGLAGSLRSMIVGNLGGEDSSVNTAAMKSTVKSMQYSVDTESNRDEIIAAIQDVQSGMKTIEILTGATANIKDIEYSMIIKAVKVWISKIETMDTITLQNTINLLDKDLEEILGGKKEEFVNKLMTVEADKLIDNFNKWKIDTKNFDNFSFNRNDLIRLVGTLGIFIELEPTVPSPSPAAMVEVWEGVITFTSSYLRYTDGTTKESKPDNGSGVFKFTINRESGMPTCIIETILEMDITGFEVTEFVYANNDFIVMFECEKPVGVKTAFYWEGIVSDDGKYIEGTCKVAVSVSDAAIEEQKDDNDQLDFPVPEYIEMNGIFYTNKIA